jgi:Uma2 family endonuclease
MAGGTPEHGGLCANLIALLSQALEGQPCRVFTSDVRVRIQATGLDTYPDASVVCGGIEKDPADRNAVVNPVLLVEVTSATTEAYDRGQKLDHYKRLTSLREVVIVAHAERRVDVWRRGEQDRWSVETSERGPIRLPSIDAQLSVDLVYRDPLAR